MRMMHSRSEMTLNYRVMEVRYPNQMAWLRVQNLTVVLYLT